MPREYGSSPADPHPEDIRSPPVPPPCSLWYWRSAAHNRTHNRLAYIPADRYPRRSHPRIHPRDSLPSGGSSIPTPDCPDDAHSHLFVSLFQIAFSPQKTTKVPFTLVIK